MKKKAEMERWQEVIVKDEILQILRFNQNFQYPLSLTVSYWEKGHLNQQAETSKWTSPYSETLKKR